MGMTSTSVRSVRMTAADRSEMVDWRKQVPDEIHGKSASQLFWVQRGFDTSAFRRCSTWTTTNHIG
jgi:predicted metalloprotease